MFKEMLKPVNFKKGIFILTAVIIFNIVFSIALFAGAKFFVDKASDRKRDIVNLTKETGFYVYQKIDEELNYKTDEDVRKDDPVILAKQNQYDALNYDITLSFDIPKQTLNGDVILKAQSLSDTLTQVYINLYDNMHVSSVSYTKGTSGDEDIPKNEAMKNTDFTQKSGYVIVNLPDKVKSGDNFLIKISYSGKTVNKGFDSFSFKELYGNMTIYSLSEPTWGPVWWPSKDLPEDKSLMSMHLIVPRGFKGVSNGMLTDTVQNDDGTTTFNWKTSYPIATYLVSIIVAKFAYWDDVYTSLDGTKQMPVVYYVFPRDSAKSRIDWKPTPDMIHYFAKTFGEYPFLNEKYGMAQFGWTSGAMEHQTLTSMGYLLITGDNRYDDVVSHELSHHWFGDAITLKNWDNIWLNEGFASYCEALWEENLHGKDTYLTYMKNFDYGYFSGTIYAPQGSIEDPAVYATVYQKGAWVLHMLRAVLGDDIFFKSIREYFDRFKYKNAETSDLINVFEEISGQKLDWFFDEWVYKGTGRPKYEYSWKAEDFSGQQNSGAYSVHIRLKQTQTDWDVYKMPVKITIETEKGTQDFTVFNNTKDQPILLTVDSKPKDVYIDREGWILKKVTKGKYEN